MFDLYIPVPQRRDVLRRFVLLVMVTLLLVAAAPAAAFAQDTLVTQGAATTEDVALAIDTMWVVVAAMLVLFMQAGFAMLEVGFSRMKNVGSVVAKILAMMGIGLIAFWVAGFALTFSDGGGLQSLIGTQGFFLSGDEATCAGLAGHRVGNHARAHQVRRLLHLRARLRWSHLPDSGALDLGRRLALYLRHAGLRWLHGRPPLGRHGGASRHAPLGAQDR